MGFFFIPYTYTHNITVERIFDFATGYRYFPPNPYELGTGVLSRTLRRFSFTYRFEVTLRYSHFYARYIESSLRCVDKFVLFNFDGVASGIVN